MILFSQAVLLSLVGAAKLGVPRLEWLKPTVGALSFSTGIGLILLAPLALVAAVGFFRLWRTAWVIGMGLQGLSLLVALVFYFYSDVRPAYIYAGMAYHIFTVAYLNSHAVKVVFRVRGIDDP